MPSSMISATRMRGLSDAYGSWKMICTSLAPRRAARRASRRARSAPSNSTRPRSARRGAACPCRRWSCRSRTRPPARACGRRRSSSETPSTALTCADLRAATRRCGSGKWTLRSGTRRVAEEAVTCDWLGVGSSWVVAGGDGLALHSRLRPSFVHATSFAAANRWQRALCPPPASCQPAPRGGRVPTRRRSGRRNGNHEFRVSAGRCRGSPRAVLRGMPAGQRVEQLARIGMRGLREERRRGAVSTISPAYMTATRVRHLGDHREIVRDQQTATSGALLQLAQQVAGSAPGSSRRARWWARPRSGAPGRRRAPSRS